MLNEIINYRNFTKLLIKVSPSFSGGAEVSSEEFPGGQRSVGAGQGLKGDVRRSAGTNGPQDRLCLSSQVCLSVCYKR